MVPASACHSGPYEVSVGGINFTSENTPVSDIKGVQVFQYPKNRPFGKRSPLWEYLPDLNPQELSESVLFIKKGVLNF